MSTLADELLLDFEDGSGDEHAEDYHDIMAPVNGPELGDDNVDDDDKAKRRKDADEDGDEEMDETRDDGPSTEEDGFTAIDRVDDAEATKAKVEKMRLGAVKDVRSVAGLMQKLEPILQKIAKFQAEPQVHVIGNIEDHPEYHLLTQANDLSTHIDSEMVIVHKFIRDHYSVRFPELETLITNPLEYAKVVTVLGNGPIDSDSIKTLQDSTQNPLGVSLRSILDGPTLMSVALTATTSKGQDMDQEELAIVHQACEMSIRLDKAKATLTDYVQSRMSVFAPNLTILIGSLTAAQLLNTAGGLTGLAKVPPCNIAAWGSKKSTGLATNTTLRQQGFLYHSPIIQSVPMDLRRQAMRIVSAKLVLAARADRTHSDAQGRLGEQFKQACLDRLEKLTEPAPNRGNRALPVPDDKPARKRGGRRARKAKEAVAMTDLRKAQNRMAFGKEEVEVGLGESDETVGLGMLGSANDGRIRGIQVDNRTRAKLSQKNKGWASMGGGGGISSSLQGGGSTTSLRAFGGTGPMDLRGKGLRTSGVGTTITPAHGAGGAAGTASSLTFAPKQGLELVDPKVREDLKRKREADQDRWFKGGMFTQVSSGSSGGSEAGGVVPKRVDTGATKNMPPPPLPK